MGMILSFPIRAIMFPTFGTSIASQLRFFGNAPSALNIPEDLGDERSVDGITRFAGREARPAYEKSCFRIRRNSSGILDDFAMPGAGGSERNIVVEIAVT
ncbi:hypothetical protein GGR34_003811 [Microvirga flocculans]|uniref:Uncharacterized protein n=1 Tax=Microvirga flocculans TaxID=217168 RepID=A0A7W6IIJ3_9HYPH|nr:hypothetical protein [Microvirga flocculans]MBB4042126.1 hypothetical protein [Microvirga flocculans]